MSEELRFLFVEDRPDDVELEERELRAAGLLFVSKRIETESEFQGAVDEFRPHLIISDYSLPGADGMVFLERARELCPDVPFIFVSGTIGEDRAVEALKKGAADYVLKGRLGALAVKVRRALREAEERTRSRQLEEQLHHAQKMETIGLLAGGIAHDFNNILTAIVGTSQLALEQVGPDSPVGRDLSQILQLADNSAVLIRQLLMFSRRQSSKPVVLNLNETVGALSTMLRRVISSDINLKFVPGAALGTVMADPGQIEQVLLNLVVNARDAMPGGGELTIETASAALDETYAANQLGTTTGQSVMLAVSDNGHGMDEATQRRIFEPFFTTKDPAKGTGLGLSTVYGIVKQHNGSIFVHSQVGKGTTFKIYLPRVLETEDTVAAAAAHSYEFGPRGSEKILLVEDQESVRQLVQRVLEGQGYIVRAASDADEGEKLFTQDEGFSLLLTDLAMPGRTGRQLYQALSGKRAGLKVLYISGYADISVLHNDAVAEDDPFLQKPFTPSDLVKKVRQILNTSPDTGGVQKRTILIADDDPAIRDTLSRFLEHRGFEVITASDGWEAMEMVREKHPDVVLLDIQMPRKGGMEVLREIQQYRQASGAEVGVIMITGVTEQEIGRSALQGGAFDYITKPFDLDYLYKVLWWKLKLT